MSKQYDPRGRIKVWLAAFDEFPEEERPTFIYRRLSSSEYDRMSEQYDCIPRPPADATPEQIAAASKKLRQSIIEVAGFGLMDWTNQVNVETGSPVSFDATALPQVINHVEAQELIAKRLSGAMPDYETKKNSVPQPC